MAAVVAGVAPWNGAAAPDARYWNVADELMSRLDTKWYPPMDAYRLGWGGAETAGNANLLVVHSVAALRDHHGPARDDTRARRITGALLRTPPYATRPSSKGQGHAPGWTASMRRGVGPSYQHMAVDAEVLDGLAHAWRARAELGLPGGLRATLRARVGAVARSTFWRWPSRTASQINWPATVAHAHAVVTGDRTLQRVDLRRHVGRFLAELGPSSRTPRWSPGWHRCPVAPTRWRPRGGSRAARPGRCDPGMMCA